MQVTGIGVAWDTNIRLMYTKQKLGRTSFLVQFWGKVLAHK